MHDPINFTSKDSMYEAAAAILRGETPSETITEGYTTKTAQVKKLMTDIEDLDADQFEDLLFSIQHMMDSFGNEFDNDDQLDVAAILMKAAKRWKDRLGN